MEQFVAQPLKRSWAFVIQQYDEALKLKTKSMKASTKKDLYNLDHWYHFELPELISQRKPKHITSEELCSLMKWKLSRGKFRPRLTELVKANSAESVIEASTEAFRALPDVSKAIKALVVLKAVGPATASAILGAGSPGHAPFMADESMQALPGLQPIKYDLPFYMAYTQKVSSIVKQLNKQEGGKEWTPFKVGEALWTYQVARTLDPTLLEGGDKCEDDDEPPKKKTKT